MMFMGKYCWLVISKHNQDNTENDDNKNSFSVPREPLDAWNPQLSFIQMQLLSTKWEKNHMLT